MKKLLLTVTLVLALSLAFAAVPQTQAAIDIINVSGDCSGATVTARFSGAGGPDDTAIFSYTGDKMLSFGALLVIGSDNLVEYTMTWDELPQGTTVTVFVDHLDYSTGEYFVQEFSYNCGPGVYPPDTSDRVVITADIPVYGNPEFSKALDDYMVTAGQEFPLVSSAINEGVTWYQVFIGGSTPWVPATAAYVE